MNPRETTLKLDGERLFALCTLKRTAEALELIQFANESGIDGIFRGSFANQKQHITDFALRDISDGEFEIVGCLRVCSSPDCGKGEETVSDKWKSVCVKNANGRVSGLGRLYIKPEYSASQIVGFLEEACRACLIAKSEEQCVSSSGAIEIPFESQRETAELAFILKNYGVIRRRFRLERELIEQYRRAG